MSVETNRGFTGHEHLDHNGLINMNARLYDPETGRFLSADIYIQEPNLLLSHNRYIYVMNNPLKYTDPSGHFWNFIIGAIISYVASQSDNPYIRTIGMVVSYSQIWCTAISSGFLLNVIFLFNAVSKCHARNQVSKVFVAS